MDFLYLLSDVCEQLDLVFLLDISGSTVLPPNNANSFDVSLQFMNDLISQLNIGALYTHVGLVLLGSSGIIQIRLNRYTQKPALMHAVSNVGFRGEKTNIKDGIRAVRDAFTTANGDRLGIRNVVIVLTDGEKHNEEEFGPVTDADISSLKALPAEVFVIMNDEYAKEGNPEFAYDLWRAAVSDEPSMHLFKIKEYTPGVHKQLAIGVQTIMDLTCRKEGIGAGALATTDGSKLEMFMLFQGILQGFNI